MIRGLRGSLLSHEALAAAGFSRVVLSGAFERARRAAAACHAAICRDGGPAWNARLVFDRVAVPICRALGLDLLVQYSDDRQCRGSVSRNGATVAAFIAFG